MVDKRDMHTTEADRSKDRPNDEEWGNSNEVVKVMECINRMSREKFPTLE